MTNGLGLGGACSEMLGRVKAQEGEKSRLGMATLMWISHSERPLKIDELCHALGVEIGSTDIDGDNVPSIGTLLTSCQGFVSVDKDTSTVRLIHPTLREHLRAHPELFDGPHATMAETCLSYLNSHRVKTLSASPSGNLRGRPSLRYSSLYSGTPFLEYSSLYWGTHAKRDLSDCAKHLALKLFDDYDGHISTELLLDAGKWRLYFRGIDKYSGFSGLHCASFFGIVEIVIGLVEAGGCDINQTDCAGNTPLVWAASNGHEEVVKILLGRDVNPDKQGNRERTPLWNAAYYGHERVLKTLLRRNGVNPNAPDVNGRTPLWAAAAHGREREVKILLGRDDVDPDRPDKYGRTPLSGAAVNGCEEVAQILLGRGGVTPDKADNDGTTPIHHAAQKGHKGIVEILLGRDDVDPEKPAIGG